MNHIFEYVHIFLHFRFTFFYAEFHILIYFAKTELSVGSETFKALEAREQRRDAGSHDQQRARQQQQLDALANLEEHMDLELSDGEPCAFSEPGGDEGEAKKQKRLDRTERATKRKQAILKSQAVASKFGRKAA